MKRRHSLSFQLTILLIIIWFLVNITAVGLFRLMVVDSDMRIYEKYIEHYITYILKDFGTPPDLDTVRKLSGEYSFGCVISHNGTELFNNTEVTLEMLEKAKSKKNPHHIRIKRRSFIKIVEGNYTYFFSPRQHERENNRFVLIFFIYMSLLFGISYMIFKHILRPLKTLQIGIDEVSSGNREHEVPVRGHDQLSLLASSFNEMNRKINRLISIKDRLLIDVGHELKSPLARIKLALEFTDSKTRELVGQDVNTLESIVDTILKTFKTSFEKNSVTRQEFTLKEEIETIISTNRFDLKHFNLLIDETLKVMANKEMFDICLKNLISNALKYSDAEKRSVEIKCGIENEWAVLAVTDFGIGIPKDDLAFIFEPFYRVDKSRSRESGGTGLGLTLCKNISDIHNWDLTVDSTLNEYTTFTLRLQRVRD
jgi:signal transduction histidine kinase